MMTTQTLQRLGTKKLSNASYGAFMEAFKALIVSPTPELLAFVNSFNKLAKDTRELWKLHKAQLGIWTEEGGWEDEEPKAETPAA